MEIIQYTIIEVLSSIVEQERLTICQRQREGINAAKRKGKHLGRKPTAYPDKWDEYYMLWLDKKITAKEFMTVTNLKRTTFYKLLHKYQDN